MKAAGAMMSDSDQKPCFGGVPLRAVKDDRLTPLDFRVLCVIARHDGFDRNRRGCFASHKRIASIVDGHYKSVTRSIARLVEAGYLSAEGQPGDGRMRIYRVQYTEKDHEAFRGDGRSHAPTKPLRSVTQPVTDSQTSKVKSREPERLRSVTDDNEIGNRNRSTTHAKRLNSNDERNRIYSTEGKEIKKGIDRAEAALCERESGAGDQTSRALPHAAGVYDVIHRAARYRDRALNGPATDGDAAIEAAMINQGHAPPIDFEGMARELSEVRPSAALLNNPLCRAARGRR